MAPMALSPPPSFTSTPTFPPLKPLLRRSTLSGIVRKRDEAGIDTPDSSMSAPSSPSKRARTVRFDPEVQEQYYSIFPELAQLEKEVDSIRLETRQAIDDHISGVSDEAYDDLKSVFAKQTSGRRRSSKDGERSESENLRVHLLALMSSVSSLGKNCTGLVRAVLGCAWIGREENVVKTYIQFLGNLASAQGSYVIQILIMLVENMAAQRVSNGRLPDCPVVTRDQLYTRTHMALRYLLRLIPSSSSALSPLLAVRFPWDQDSTKDLMVYVNNLITMTEYAPELRSDILSLITDRLVKIDLQVQLDLDEVDDEVAASLLEPLKLHNGLGSPGRDSDIDSDSESESVTDTDIDEDDHLKTMQANFEKMDRLLGRLFEYYTPYFIDPESPEAMSAFATLLSQFRNIILPSYRSRHTQFLLFHFAQKSDHLVDTFAGECVDLAFKSGRPAVLKQSAAAYLASFVSRGAHVLPHTVREVFEFIGVNLDKIRKENEAGCRGPDLQRYGTFYATTQALLYIFCFRWRDLIISDGNDITEEYDYLDRDLKWNAGVKELLVRTIYSKLNPLKICAPGIVDEFARIANHLKFMYVYPLLETNKRVRVSQFALGIAALRDSGVSNISREDTESWNQLDAYFPFDPYRLPRSKGWVEGDYVEWRGLPGLGKEEDESDISSEEDQHDDTMISDQEEGETITIQGFNEL